jgi:hypothetical protein
MDLPGTSHPSVEGAGTLGKSRSLPQMGLLEPEIMESLKS